MVRNRGQYSVLYKMTESFLAMVVNILCILFTFGKLKLLMVKLLPTPGYCPTLGRLFPLLKAELTL